MIPSPSILTVSRERCQITKAWCSIGFVLLVILEIYQVPQSTELYHSSLVIHDYRRSTPWPRVVY